MAASAVLEPELDTYEKNRDALLGAALGKWVLIHGDQVIGTFDTQDDAIAEGYRQFGNVPFLTKEIVELEAPAYFSSSYVAF